LVKAKITGAKKILWYYVSAAVAVGQSGVLSLVCLWAVCLWLKAILVLVLSCFRKYHGGSKKLHTELY